MSIQQLPAFSIPVSQLWMTSQNVFTQQKHFEPTQSISPERMIFSMEDWRESPPQVTTLTNSILHQLIIISVIIRQLGKSKLELSIIQIENNQLRTGLIA